MATQRRSYETGHKPKCLVIVDDTAEWDRAVYYASRWAIRIGGGVVMLRIIETEDQNQQWLGVAEVMRAEAHEEANAALDRAAGRAKSDVLGEFGGGQFSSFKNALVDLCVAKLSPIASEMKKLVADPGHVDAVLVDGADRARVIADETMKATKDIVGFIRKA